jgi:transcriptional regulator
VLAIFAGPHTYVSASWYSDPKQASTWNYVTVHAHGKLTFLGEQELLDILKQTTSHFENRPDSPALFEHLREDYVRRLSKAIIAFEIEVQEIDNVFKLSQNRDKESYEEIISRLDEQGGEAAEIADEMKRRAAQLFKEGGENFTILPTP